jgi:signal transduction histidine kinase
MEVIGDSALEGETHPSSSIGARRIIFLLFLAVSLGAIQPFLTIFLPQQRLPMLPWIGPAVEAFCLGGGLSLALLFIWRFLMRREPYGLWVGVAFWLSSLLNLAYVLTLQGLIPDLRSAPTYLFYLLYFILLLPCLSFVLGDEKAPFSARAKVLRALGGSSLVCLVVIWGVISLEDYLPFLSIAVRHDSFSRSIPYLFLVMYAAGIFVHWRRFQQTREPLVGYVLVFFMISLWVFAGMVLSRGPFDIAWYSSRALRVFGYVSIYLVLLREYSDLYQQTQRREDMQKLLKELSQDITTLDLDSLLKKLTEKVREVFRVDISDVRVLEDGAWRLLGISGIESERLRSGHTRTSRGRARWVIENRRPLVIPDVERQPDIPRGEVLTRLGIRGYVGIPLFSKSREVMAVLRALTYQPREFTQEEVDLLQQLANGTAVAIENATLLQALKGKTQELQSMNRQLNRLVNEQSALRQILTDLNLLEVDHLLDELSQQTLTLLRVDHVQVRLLGENGVLRTVALAGKDADRYRGHWLRSGRGRSTKVMESQKPLAIKDIREDRMFGPGNLMREMGVRGCLCVPLISRERQPIGVLMMTSLAEREFTLEEVSLAQQLAAGATVAIENAKFFEEVKRKSRDLEQAFQAKSDFLNTMAHELRTPLNVVIGTQELLMHGLYGELTAGQKESLKRIDRNVHDLLSLIDDILDLARLEAKRVPLRIEEFSLAELMEELGHFFSPLTREKGLNFIFNLDHRVPLVKNDRSKIKEVLQNLLSNAIKYTDKGEIEIRVAYQPNEDGGEPREGRVSIAVRDTGVGIRTEDLSHISEPFYMGDGIDRTKYHGTGLGLSITKGIVELLKGNLELESEWGKGSIFTVTLPLVHPS